VDECKPLPVWYPPAAMNSAETLAECLSSAVVLGARSRIIRTMSVCPPKAATQGLTLAHFRAQLEDLRDTTLTLELNLSTFGTHPRVNLAYMKNRVERKGAK